MASIFQLVESAIEAITDWMQEDNLGAAAAVTPILITIGIIIELWNYEPVNPQPVWYPGTGNNPIPPPNFPSPIEITNPLPAFTPPVVGTLPPFEVIPFPNMRRNLPGGLPLVTPDDVATQRPYDPGLGFSDVGSALTGHSTFLRTHQTIAGAYEFTVTGLEAGQSLVVVQFDPNVGESGAWKASVAATNDEWFLVLPLGVTAADLPVGYFQCFTTENADFTVVRLS